MIALGIDPGSVRTGWGVVRRDGSRLTRLGSGTISTRSKDPLESRLLVIHTGLEEVLTSFGPDEVAVEDLFLAKNAMSALKLGHARGVALLAVARRGLPVTSYAPALVKRAVAGGGRAPKGQMQRVVQSILALPDLPAEDEADALAIAVCHLNASRLPPAARAGRRP